MAVLPVPDLIPCQMAWSSACVACGPKWCNTYCHAHLAGASVWSHWSPTAIIIFLQLQLGFDNSTNSLHLGKGNKAAVTRLLATRFKICYCTMHDYLCYDCLRLRLGWCLIVARTCAGIGSGVNSCGLSLKAHRCQRIKIESAWPCLTEAKTCQSWPSGEASCWRLFPPKQMLVEAFIVCESKVGPIIMFSMPSPSI